MLKSIRAILSSLHTSFGKETRAHSGCELVTSQLTNERPSNVGPSSSPASDAKLRNATVFISRSIAAAAPVLKDRSASRRLEP